MDDNKLNIIEAHSVNHNYDVKALIAEVRRLSAENAALRMSAAMQSEPVTENAVDKCLADVSEEIFDAAIEYIFGTYGQPAELARNAFESGATLGLQIAARIVQYGE